MTGNLAEFPRLPLHTESFPDPVSESNYVRCVTRDDAIHRALGLTNSEADKIAVLLGRPANHLELAMYSVMWSEHCSYKSSRLHLAKFPTTGPRVLQGPGENAGAINQYKST